MKKIKYLFAFCLLITTLMTLLLPAFGLDASETVGNHAKAYYLYNLENQTVLASLNTDATVAPGSTVKIMTGLLLCENAYQMLDERVTVTKDMIDSVQGRYAGLRAGWKISIRDLLYMSLCGSYNDAIKILEIYLFGSETNFVKAMNEKAKHLGMNDTKYTNATGVDDEYMKTSVSDLVILALEAHSNDLLMNITSASEYETESLDKSFAFTNFNKLHVSGSYKNSMCSGLNAGNTPLSGYCAVTFAEKNGLSYLCIVMGADCDEKNTMFNYVVTNRLINFGIDNFSYLKVVKKSDIICELPVSLSLDTETVLVIPSSDFSIYRPNTTEVGRDITVVPTLTTDSLSAPVSEGLQVGNLEIYENGVLINTIPLITKTSVTRSELIYKLAQIKEFSQSTFFIASVISAASLTLIYIVVRSVIRSSGNRRRRRF